MNLNFGVSAAFCMIIVLLMGGQGSRAQSGGQVVYHHYGQQENVFLAGLKKDSKISSFNPMSVLKKNALDIKEGTIIPVKLAKAGKKVDDTFKMMERRKESVPFICLYLPGGKQPEKVVTFATAIVLSEDGVCATNYHVLSGLIDRSIKLNPGDSLLFVGMGSGKIYGIQSILSYNKAADLALFKLDTKGDKLIPIPIGQDLPEGAEVQAMTHPDGYPFFYSRGYVHRTVTSKPEDPFYNRMEMSADYAVGSSGGPILDKDGNLVAVVSTTRSVYAIPNLQRDLQMVVKSTIPVSSMLRLIKIEK